jgi:hypothetical protein
MASAPLLQVASATSKSSTQGERSCHDARRWAPQRDFSAFAKLVTAITDGS